MGLWSNLFGRSPPPPPRGRLFEDRSPAERVYYSFQHVALRNTAFYVGPPFWKPVIEGGRIGEQNARFLWAKATQEAVSTGTVPPEMIQMQSDPAARAALDAGAATVAGIPVFSYRRDGYTAWVFEMPPPKFATDAHFIAAMSKDDGPQSLTGPGADVRYFLLEATLFPEPMLCEWTADGRHQNHGSRPALDRERFASAVFDLADGGR